MVKFSLFCNSKWFIILRMSVHVHTNPIHVMYPMKCKPSPGRLSPNKAITYYKGSFLYLRCRTCFMIVENLNSTLIIATTKITMHTLCWYLKRAITLTADAHRNKN